MHTLLHSTHQTGDGEHSFVDDHQYIAVFENKMFEHIGMSGEITTDPSSAFFVAKISSEMAVQIGIRQGSLAKILQGK